MGDRNGSFAASEGIVSSAEYQSSLVRLAVWIFGTGYISLAARTGYYKVDVPYFLGLLTIFTLLYLAMFVSVRSRPEWPARRYVAVALDIVAISLAIFVTREAISPFYLLYIWIFISAGTRYGTRHLILASIEAVIAYSLVLHALGQWQKHPYEAVFFLLLLVLLPLYQIVLLRRIREAKDEAERANKAKGDFLAFMTHELRTPLTGVIGMTELLRGTELDAEQRDYVEAISHSANVLAALIGDILDFSRIDAARLTLEQAPFDPRAVVREVCGVLEAQTLAEGVELICYVAPEVPRQVLGDQLRVRQILFNLVGNAVKFTEEGQIEVRLGLSLPVPEVSRPHLLLEVVDTGIGIPQDKLVTIFESFSQADDSTTRRFGGSGLGTAIARQLAALMGGAIGVESAVGEGSRFWVRLPLIGDTMPKPPEPGGRLGGRRVLILESNLTQRQLIGAALEREGAHCQGAGDLDELGGRPPRAEDPDLAVIADSPRGLDLDGVRAALFERIGRECPCLFLSYASRPLTHRPESGPSVAKPFLSEDLVAGAERLLGLVESTEPPHGGEGPAGTVQSSATGRVAVLVAEDNAIAAKVITAFLGKLGIDHTRVEDGGQALEAALTGRYGIAIVDLRMPKLDGIEFARRYRAAAPDRPMPIVALTANASEEVRQRCLEAGMDAFLAKPVSQEQLRQTVERLALPHPPD